MKIKAMMLGLVFSGALLFGYGFNLEKANKRLMD